MMVVISWLVLGSITMLAAMPPEPPAASPKASPLERCSWLLGTWRTGEPPHVTRESWTAASGSTWEGETITVSADDGKIQFTESLRIVAMAGEIFYLAKVAHNTLPVAFKLIQMDDHVLVFENPSHDFPRRMTYRLTEQNRLEVVVEGIDERSGKPTRLELAFRKEK